MAQGALFEAVMVDHDSPNDPRLLELIDWAAFFAGQGLTPSYGLGDHGNLSCRTPQGLLISARATSKAHLRAEQFVEVIGWEERTPQPQVRCRGRFLPSSDTLLHLSLYAVRPDIQAIFHAHDPRTLSCAQALGLPVTAHSASFQSMEVIEEVRRLAAAHAYILLRDHGFLALGRSIREAGELARLWYELARRASIAASAVDVKGAQQEKERD